MRFLRYGLSWLLIVSVTPISEPRSSPSTPPQSGSISTSANNFLEICKHVEEEGEAKYAFNNGLCIGWVQGYVDGLTIVDEFRQTPEGKKMSCPPAEVKVIQFTRIIHKYIDEHPERSHMPTRYLASEALIRAFPCIK
jgi:hypothetical protein